jgi:hypothetical protein
MKECNNILKTIKFNENPNSYVITRYKLNDFDLFELELNKLIKLSNEKQVTFIKVKVEDVKDVKIFRNNGFLNLSKKSLIYDKSLY